uniref:Uncharacterized protein n=1 Tax=Oryza glumipatula TaxID=40148 RepID=A0A0D9YQN1_9ORYZ
MVIGNELSKNHSPLQCSRGLEALQPYLPTTLKDGTFINLVKQWLQELLVKLRSEKIGGLPPSVLGGMLRV